jgi:DNA-binding transcriptional ArsR family regulator
MRVHAPKKRLSHEHVSLIASRGRALGEPTRVRILEALARVEQPVGQLATALGTQQSTVSKHLQVLFHAGLVQRRRSAAAVIYSISTSRLIDWCAFLGSRQLTKRVR